MPAPKSKLFAIALVLIAVAATLAAQPIDPSRGSDPNVEYTSLARFGPWDDRNYDLRAADLELLAPIGHEEEPIAAVVLRRNQQPSELQPLGECEGSGGGILNEEAEHDG